MRPHITVFAMFAITVLPGPAQQRPETAARPRPGAASTDTFPRLELFLDWPGRPVAEMPAAGTVWLVEDGRRGAAASSMRRFRESGKGIALVAVLDVSGSMKGAPLEQMKQGLIEFIDQQRPVDRLMVLTVADDVQTTIRWNDGPDAERAAIHRLTVRGQRTRLWDAVYQAADQVNGASADLPARQRMLIVSDGHDEGSRTSIGLLTEAIDKRGIVVDSLIMTARTGAFAKDLRALAEVTGGEARDVASAEQLRLTLRQGIQHVWDTPVYTFVADSRLADGAQHEYHLQWGGGGRSRSLLLSPVAPPWWDRWAPDMRIRWALSVSLGLMALGLLSAAFRRRRAPAQAAEPRVYQPATEAPIQRLAAATPSTHPPTSLDPAVPTPLPATASTPAAAAARQRTILVPQIPAPAPGRPAIWLKAVAGPRNGSAYAVETSDFWVGADLRNNLIIGEDPTLSGVHARIRYHEGAIRVHNLSQTNGTYLNGDKLGQEAYLLAAGDHLQMGASHFLVAPGGMAPDALGRTKGQPA